MKNWFVIFICFLIACSQQPQNVQFGVIGLDPENARPVACSDLIEDITLIPLQTTDDAIIGEVTAVAEHGDLYFVFDSQTKSVFTFDHSGAFRYRICRVGKGPGEYINLDGMYVDREKDLLVLDGGSKCLYYKCDNGEYIREERYALSNGFKTYLGEGAFVSYVFYPTKKSNEKLVFEHHGKITASVLPIEKSMTSSDISTEHFFYASDDHHYFIEPYQDTVYRLTPQSATIECLIDFGKKNLPPSFLENTTVQDRMTTLYDSPFCHSIENFYSNRSFTTFRYLYKDDLYFYFKQGKSDSVIHTSYSKITDDLLGNTFLWMNFLWCSENFTLSAAEMMQIHETVQRTETMLETGEDDFISQYGETSPEVARSFYRSMAKAIQSEYIRKLKEIALLPEESNPVLIKLKWKD